MGGKTKKLTIVSGKKPVMTISKKKKKLKVKLPALNHKMVKGHGSYSIGDVAKAVVKPFVDNTPSEGIVNKTARYAGSKLGDMTGIPGAGEALGNASSWLARVFGFGRYQIRKNSLMSYSGENIPQFSDNGGLTMAHREYVMDINSSTIFNNQGFLINAGNPLLFPWLSRLASNYEEFEFLGLIFEFKSTSATAVGSTNTGLGTLIMATDYDCIDSNYTDKRSMEIADFATSDAPCYNQIHPVECDPRKNVMRKYFVQNATTLAGYPDDPRFSVLGNFQIATSGVQSSSNVGELWVSYHVKLSKPQIASLSSIQSQPFVHFQYNNVNATTDVPVATYMYPSNGGLTLTTNTAYVNITCSNVLGLGSYLAVFRSVDVASGGTINNYTTTIAQAFSGANINGTIQSITGGSASAAAYGNAVCGIIESATPIQRPGTLSFVIFTFTAVNQSVRLFGCTDNSNTIKNDVYVVPYALPNLGKPPSEKQMMRQKLDEMYNLISQMKSPSPGPTVDCSSAANHGSGNCVFVEEEMRRPERRPPCIDTSNRLPLTPIDEYRYVEVVRSEPSSKDTSQLRKQ